jgi:hypothetical protein
MSRFRRALRAAKQKDDRENHKDDYKRSDADDHATVVPDPDPSKT